MRLGSYLPTLQFAFKKLFCYAKNMQHTISGTWLLKDYTFVKDGQTEFHDDINGLLIYANDGWFTQNLKYPETPKQPYHAGLIKNYYYGGKYSLTPTEIAEENLIHVVDHKVGEKRRVGFSLKDGTLTKTCNFGDSVLTTRWVRAQN